MAVLRRHLVCWLVFGCLAVSCSVNPPEGQLQCESDDDCPPDWFCNVYGDELCYSNDDEFPDPDGGTDVDSDADSDSDSDTDSDTDSCEGVATVFDFESGAEGFSHDTLGDGTDPWERGNPDDESCHSGDACFCTALSGDYQPCQSAHLLSPRIDLSCCAGEPENLELAFFHYYVFQDQAAGSWRDGGAVQFSNNDGSTWEDVVPQAPNGYTGSINGNYSGPCNDIPSELDGQDAWSGGIPGDSWQQVSLPIDNSFKTDAFRFRFLFSADRAGEETGWFIDDIEIRID